MTAAQMQAAREEMARCLKRKPGWRLRLRLQAIDLALTGKMEDAAALAHVKTTTVQQWLDAIRRNGIEIALAKWEQRARPRKLHADAAELREAAMREGNPRIKRRLTALANVADGIGVDDAAVQSRLDRASLYLWIRRYQEKGMEAIRTL